MLGVGGGEEGPQSTARGVSDTLRPKGRPLPDSLLFSFFAVAKMYAWELLLRRFPRSLKGSAPDVHFTVC